MTRANSKLLPVIALLAVAPAARAQLGIDLSAPAKKPAAKKPPAAGSSSQLSRTILRRRERSNRVSSLTHNRSALRPAVQYVEQLGARTTYGEKEGYP